MSDKLISVILPVYNGEKFLAESIDSVINQTYKNLELIIVNDCSTDKSLEIANNYATLDSRIKVISNKTNKKLPASLNIGFKYAKGEYLTWTSDDNLYKPQALKKMYEFLENNQNYIMVCAKYDVFQNNMPIYSCTPEPYPWKLIFENSIGACFLYRKSVLESVGEYNVDWFLVEDYEYWLRTCLVGKIGIIYENLYTYRLHDTCLSVNRIKEVECNTKKVQAKYWHLYLEKFPWLENAKISRINDKIKKLPQHNDIGTLNNNYNSNILYKQYKQSYINTNNEIYLKAMRRLGFKYRIKSWLLKLKNKHKDRDIILSEIDNLRIYERAVNWIDNYTLDNSGIVVNSKNQIIYQEVTGYYIPTLLKFGDKKRAIAFADYLVSMQNEDGSWNEPSNTYKYTFDTGQILKGLYEFKDINEKYKNALIKGCDYIVSMQRENGSIATDNYSWWGLPYGKSVPEAIHLYCLEPLQKLANEYGISKYANCVDRALKFYLSDNKLTDFDTLSHFHAYIIEALIDLGVTDRAKEAMNLVAKYQSDDGFVPAYSHVKFVCSTGLFQYAICWFKLGDIERGNKAFNYAKKLQNDSGGWYGSYGKGANYFEDAEISWAVKYFFDALYYKLNTEYNSLYHIFSDTIDLLDGRYKLVENSLKDANTILEAGCGKGRYTRNLIDKYPNRSYFGFDFSSEILKFTHELMSTKHGGLLQIPFDDEQFDFVFCVEALEHCIDIQRAIEELSRVVKKGGRLLIIDKDIEKLGIMQIAEWEQWFDVARLKDIMERNGFVVEVVENISYDNNNLENGLFVGWLGYKK